MGCKDSCCGRAEAPSLILPRMEHRAFSMSGADSNLDLSWPTLGFLKPWLSALHPQISFLSLSPHSLPFCQLSCSCSSRLYSAISAFRKAPLVSPPLLN